MFTCLLRPPATGATDFMPKFDCPFEVKEIQNPGPSHVHCSYLRIFDKAIRFSTGHSTMMVKACNLIFLKWIYTPHATVSFKYWSTVCIQGLCLVCSNPSGPFK
jgi:hypothetical protein